MKSLIERLKEKYPGKNPILVAIYGTNGRGRLKDPEEIRRLYVDYIAYLRRNGGTKKVRNNPIRVAKSNIGYWLLDASEKTRKLWEEALPELYED